LLLLPHLQHQASGLLTLQRRQLLLDPSPSTAAVAAVGWQLGYASWQQQQQQ
jgi:hypothetical protein